MPLFKRSLTARKKDDQTKLRNLNKSRSLRNTDSYHSVKWSSDLQNIPSGDSQLLVSSSDDENESGTFSADQDQKDAQKGFFNFSMQKGKDINTIAVTKNRGWISCWNNNEVALVNRHGEIRKVISLDTIITDVSFSSATKELWMCCRDNSVREREPPDSARVAFKTISLPLSLCMLGDGSALVGMEFRITKFDLNGRVLQTIDKLDLGGVPLVYPERIRQCHETGQIGIVDRAFKAWGGSGKPGVLVLHEDFKFKFHYCSLDHTNQFSLYQCVRSSRDSDEASESTMVNKKSEDIDSNDKNTSSPKQNPNQSTGSPTSDDFVNIFTPTSFNPRDMCFGPQGQIIIADYDNKMVFSINSSGEFQGKILSNDVRPCALDCELNGKLWIGCKRQIVKLIQLSL